MLNSLFGKYRFLVISIALFLIFDLGVLVLNFYTSGKIAEQAELINLAGRQRTLTQQMSKATLYIKSQKLQSWVYQSGLDELRNHYNTFGETLRVFNQGGEIESPNTGLPISVQAVESAEGKAILDEASALWVEFEQAIQPLMVDILITDEEIRPASAFIAANNLKMFGHMDELTEFFKTSAERQTTFLRRAQVVGISLATINFFIILFHFLGQLRGRDRKLQIKQHESDQILNTINEGVFLVDQRLRMSGQYSRQLEEIFAVDGMSERRFHRFLAHYLPKKTVATAVDFIKLYFREHIDPELIEDVNPLKCVEANIVNQDGEANKKYLDFSFARLDQGEQEKASVLVTVRDVTAKTLLEAQDQQAEDDLNQQMALLTQILPIPMDELDQFLVESNDGYDRINALLKDTKFVNDNFNATLTRIAREAHKLKGNAAALNIDWIAEQHHNFEDNLQALREQSRIKTLSGRDFLPLAIKLKQSYETIELVQELRDKLGSYGLEHLSNTVALSAKGSDSASQPKENRKWFNLNEFTRGVAAEEGCAVTVNLRGFNSPLPLELTAKLYPIAVQLIRNSIAHGIESSDERAGLKKPNQGQITIAISHDKEGYYRFLYEDDGRGFDYDAIRQNLIDKGYLTQGEAHALGNTGLVRYAFKDTVSTRKQADQLAGRGVGLPLVWQQLKDLKGKLKIRSVQNEFTQFIFDFHHAQPLGNIDPETPPLRRAS
ncbi:MAG: type IV pili methyl-accepting chemotaxis transducer N-terminal domain-containing protein [Acidiferrobacterales bacterium]|nr:type IV pili methyl-accepting chemotaxis transducer N-terminal domain-containing protein [Acidiferrobacterales bacterium]